MIKTLKFLYSFGKKIRAISRHTIKLIIGPFEAQSNKIKKVIIKFITIKILGRRCLKRLTHKAEAIIPDTEKFARLTGFKLVNESRLVIKNKS